MMIGSGEIAGKNSSASLITRCNLKPKLQPVEPLPRVVTFKDFVLLNSSIVANGDEAGINFVGATTISKAIEQIQAQPAQQAWHSLPKASRAYELRKFCHQIALNKILIVRF